MMMLPTKQDNKNDETVYVNFTFPNVGFQNDDFDALCMVSYISGDPNFPQPREMYNPNEITFSPVKMQ